MRPSEAGMLASKFAETCVGLEAAKGSAVSAAAAAITAFCSTGLAMEVVPTLFS